MEQDGDTPEEMTSMTTTCLASVEKPQHYDVQQHSMTQSKRFWAANQAASGDRGCVYDSGIGRVLSFPLSGQHQNTPGKWASSSFHSTGLGRDDRAPAMLRSCIAFMRASVPIETYTAPGPLKPWSKNALSSLGRALGLSARMGPTNCARVNPLC